jgi:hypothetical protein
MGFMDKSNQYGDFQYIIDDLYAVTIGAKLSYAQLMDNEDLSYKYRCIIKRYFLQEVADDTTLESHFYYMAPDAQSTEIYDRMRTKVRIYYPVTRTKGGRSETVYEERVMKPSELAAIPPASKEKMGIIVHEVEISKRGLMNYAM